MIEKNLNIKVGDWVCVENFSPRLQYFYPILSEEDIADLSKYDLVRLATKEEIDFYKRNSQPYF